jgi:2',3'-cyclic-nucleotide 2'-phosphodiesterase (5'-nucleotidase family)
MATKIPAREGFPMRLALVAPILALTAAVAAPAMGEPGETARSLQVPAGALIAPGSAPDLVFLYSGDVIGYLEDCGCKLNPAGGLARRQWLKDQIASAYPGTPLVLLDSGNFSDNPNEQGEMRTRGLLEGMNRLGYEVVNAAERDLSLGLAAFRERTQGSRARFVSANVVKFGTKDPVLDPYAVLEVPVRGRPAPLRVGVVGAVRFNPVWKKAGSDGGNIGIAPPAEMLRKVLPELRSKADVVVLLASMSREEAGALAREVPGIDFVFGAYGGMISTRDEQEGTARVVYVGNQGQRVGETRVYLSPEGGVRSSTTYLHFLTVRYPSSPEMEAFVGEVTAKVKGISGGAAAAATH